MLRSGRRRDRQTETDLNGDERHASPQLGIRSTLMLMVLAPVVILLPVIAIQIFDRFSVLYETHELREMIPLVRHASYLVHELQRERGLSALLLGSRGAELAGQLDEQYLRTDESRAILTDALLRAVDNEEGFLEALTLEDGTPVLEAANPLDIFPHLKDLEEHRSKMQRVDSDLLETLAFYSSLDGELLAFGVELSRWTPDPDIVNLIWAHNAVARATDAADLERLLLGHAIATEKLSHDDLARLASLIGSQEVQLDVARRHVTFDHPGAYEETLIMIETRRAKQPDSPASTMILFRDTAFSGDVSNLDAEEWWTAATLRIAALHNLEGELLDDMVAKSLVLQRSAYASLFQFAIVALLAVTAVAVAWVLGGRVARRTRSLTAVATAICNGDLERRTDVAGRDELGTLGEAFNDMADHLTSMIAGRDQFIATVSHELRTPLTTVIGYTELLRAGAPGFSPKDRDTMVDAIAREAAELDSLIQDLLVTARTTDRGLVVVEVCVDLEAQAAQVIKTLDPGTPVHLEAVEDSLRATGDPMRVRQILRNLISNAIRYGGPRIEVRFRRGEHHVSVLVSDDGNSIDIARRERIFAPYETASAGAVVPGSIGLGLAVARTLARLMGGDVTYRYTNSESLFELTLPVWIPEEPDLESTCTRHPQSLHNTD